MAMTEKQVERWKWQSYIGEVDIGCYKKRQDKERVCDRDGKTYKAGRQTSGHKVMLVCIREEERRRLRWGKNDRDMAIPGKRKRGRPKKRWMDLV